MLHFSYLKYFYVGLAILFSCTFSTQSWGETVRVNLSNEDFGHGWIFVDPKHRSCRLAVPAHVITRNNRLLSPFVKTDEGRSYLTKNPKKIPSLDLAIVELVEADPLNCAKARPLFSNEVSRLKTLKSAWLEHFIGEEEFASDKVKILSRTLEDATEAKFIISLDDEQSVFMKGMSGSMVYAEDRRPLGMLIEVDSEENYGIVMRFDSIRNAIRSTAPNISLPLPQNTSETLTTRTIVPTGKGTYRPPQPIAITKRQAYIPGTYPLSDLKVTGFSGIPVSALKGPENVLISNGNDWVTLSEGKSAFVSISPLTGSLPVSRVIVRQTGNQTHDRQNLKRLIVHGSFDNATTGPWSYITACEPLSVGALFDCRVFNKRAKALKLSFVTNTKSSQISIGHLEIYK